MYIIHKFKNVETVCDSGQAKCVIKIRPLWQMFLNYRSNLTMYLIGVVSLFPTLVTLFIMAALFFTSGVKVSSQSKKAIDDSDKKQSNSKHFKDGVQEFIDVLETNNVEILSSTKITAIKRLGDARVKRAIPLLIKYLDYEDEVAVERSKPTTINGIIIITEENDLYLSGRYPAVGALFQIGKPSLPELVKVIENEESNSVKSQNALFAVQQIFIEDLLKSILYFEKASTESKTSNGSERLQVAAKRTGELLERISNNKPIN